MAILRLHDFLLVLSLIPFGANSYVDLVCFRDLHNIKKDTSFNDHNCSHQPTYTKNFRTRKLHDSPLCHAIYSLQSSDVTSKSTASTQHTHFHIFHHSTPHFAAHACLRPHPPSTQAHLPQNRSIPRTNLLSPPILVPHTRLTIIDHPIPSYLPKLSGMHSHTRHISPTRRGVSNRESM